MTYGDNQSTSNIENVTGTINAGGTSVAIDTDVDAATPNQEEKERVFERVERVMDIFRKGEYSRFQASSHVLDELEKWTSVSDKEKGKAFDIYLAEINSPIVIQDEERSATKEASQPLEPPLHAGHRPKRVRDEIEDLLDQLSRGEPDRDEGELRVSRRRVREDEMPWYNPITSSARRTSCIETCKTLLQFSEDLSGVKSLLRVADNLPEGIPSSQWDRLLRGESVDLNQILSSTSGKRESA